MSRVEEEMEDEYEEEMEASESEEEVVVGQMPTVMVPKHINKRALKNRALSVTLDPKALRDFVTGFHKRKKKRRKEAQKISQEKERKKKIQNRKKRKEEKEIAVYGRVLSKDDADDAGLEKGDAGNDGEEVKTTDALSEVKTYEDDGTRITVTTCEITHEDEDDGLGPKPIGSVSASYTNKKPSVAAKKNPSLGVKKKQQMRTFKTKGKKKKGDKKRGTAKGKGKNKGKK